MKAVNRGHRWWLWVVWSVFLWGCLDKSSSTDKTAQDSPKQAPELQSELQPVPEDSGITPQTNPEFGEVGFIQRNEPIWSHDDGHIHPAEIRAFPTAHNFQLQSINSTHNVVFTLTNLGDKPAENIMVSGLRTPYSFRGGMYPGLRATCTTRLDPHASCTIALSFHPTQIGSYPLESLMITYSNESSNRTVVIPLTGRASEIATLQFSNGFDDEPSFDFGQLVVGQTFTKKIRVRYFGAKPATGVTLLGVNAPFYVTSNSCLEEVNNDCEIDIKFSSASINRFSQKWRLSYHNNSFATETLFDVTAESVPAVLPAQLIISNGVEHDFGNVILRQSAEQTLSVTRTGTLPATRISAKPPQSGFQFKGGQYPGIGGTCSDTLFSTCTMVVVFTPSDIGSYYSPLTLDFFNGETDTSASIRLSVNGKNTAELSLIGATRIDFGITFVGMHALRSLGLSNRVDSVAATNIRLASLDAPYHVSSTNCANGVGEAGTCSINLRFSPTTATENYQLLQISYFDGLTTREDIVVALVGRGDAHAYLVAHPAVVDFGNVLVGFSTSATLLLEHYGVSLATNLTISGLDAPFSYTGNVYPGGGTCSQSIAAACLIGLTFSPPQAGFFQKTLTIRYDDGAKQQPLTVVLQGSGIAIVPLRLAFEPISLNMGELDVGQTTSHFVKVKRVSGNFRATQLSVSQLNSDFSFVGGTYPGGGASCTTTYEMATNECLLHLSFHPQTKGLRQASLTLSYHDGFATQEITLPLYGTGRQQARIVADELNFQSVIVGDASTKPVLFRNIGSGDASNVSFSALVLPFAVIDHNCPSILIMGASCLASIRFTPTSLSVHSSLLSLNFHDGNDATSLHTRIAGQGISGISLSVNRNNLGEVAYLGQLKADIELKNSGPRAANYFSIDASSITAPFSITSHNCATTLVSQEACTVSLRFEPTRPGKVASEFVVRYDSGAGMVTQSFEIRASGTISMLLASNGNHNCARTRFGELKCWGQNRYGQLGLGDTLDRGSNNVYPLNSSTAAVRLGTNRYPKNIAVGSYHSCAILDDNSVKCWGANSYGQLGLAVTDAMIGNRLSQMGDNLPTVKFGEGVPQSLALGHAHSCILLDNGAVKCWGQNSEGQLGLGDTESRGLLESDMDTNLPTIDLGANRAISLAAGSSHNCVILEDGALKCWGNNFFGQLGIGDLENRGDDPAEMARLASVDFGGVFRANQVAAGGAFTCVILDDNSLRCWGRNEKGILGRSWCQDAEAGLGPCSNSGFPLPLRGLGISWKHLGDNLPIIKADKNVSPVLLAAGNSSVCVKLNNHSIKCWGDNMYGQLGAGDTVNRGENDADMEHTVVPVDLDGSSGSIDTLTSGYAHNCVLQNGTNVKCWGYNRYGNLGKNDTKNRGDSPNEMGVNLIPLDL